MYEYNFDLWEPQGSKANDRFEQQFTVATWLKTTILLSETRAHGHLNDLNVRDFISIGILVGTHVQDGSGGWLGAVHAIHPIGMVIKKLGGASAVSTRFQM